jgi:hypothetical protein
MESEGEAYKEREWMAEEHDGMADEGTSGRDK